MIITAKIQKKIKGNVIYVSSHSLSTFFQKNIHRKLKIRFLIVTNIELSVIFPDGYFVFTSQPSNSCSQIDVVKFRCFLQLIKTHFFILRIKRSPYKSSILAYYSLLHTLYILNYTPFIYLK